MADEGGEREARRRPRLLSDPNFAFGMMAGFCAPVDSRVSHEDDPSFDPWSVFESPQSGIRVDDSPTMESLSPELDPVDTQESMVGDDVLHSRHFDASNAHADNSSGAAAQPAVDPLIYITRARDQNLQIGPIPSPRNPPARVGASPLSSNGGSSISPDMDHPAFRMQRLIESTNRCRIPRYRPSQASEADSLRNNILQSQLSLEASRKMKRDGSDEQEEEKNGDASNFECNICFDLAKCPVVTPCGHLFCWQCLYQWLHVNSSCSECPVCKGKVLDVNVTPIYGRGRTKDNKCEERESGIEIPPRPHAKRIESTRQQHHAALLQIIEGRDGIRRFILDEEVPNGDRTLPSRSSTPRRRLNATQLSNGVRLRTQRTQRDVGSRSNPAAVGMPSENTLEFQLPEHHNNTTSPESMVVSGGGDHDALPPVSTTGPLVEPSHHTRHRMESSFATNHSSDSSTMAVIHGDPVSNSELQSTLTDASTGPISRPSITNRRRGRNVITDSVLDHDGPNQSRSRRF